MSARLAPLPTRIRHVVRNAAVTVVTVHPGDGRYPEEFRISPAELRRFAWAVLADLDPQEAQAAATEAGVAIADLVRPIHIENRGGDQGGRPNLRAGTKKWQLLQAAAEIEAGGDADLAWYADAVPEATRPDYLLFELTRDGFLEKTGRGRWRLAEAGRQALPLGPAPQPRPLAEARA